MMLEKPEEQYKAQIAALQLERDQLTAALRVARTPEHRVSVSDYEWHVQLAAKGIADRSAYPIPKSVTTAEAFYQIMAGAAVDATGLWTLLERVARAESDLEIIQDALRHADAKAAKARHRAMTDTAASLDFSVPSVSMQVDAERALKASPTTGGAPSPKPPAVAKTPAPKRTGGLSPRRRLKRAVRRVRIVLR